MSDTILISVMGATSKLNIRIQDNDKHDEIGDGMLKGELVELLATPHTIVPYLNILGSRELSFKENTSPNVDDVFWHVCDVLYKRETTYVNDYIWKIPYYYLV